MYNIAEYGLMIGDKVRMSAYTEALRQAVKSGSVVLDLGAGTGIFALLACRFGARRVYALEPNDAIQAAREIAAANGNAERIEFIQGLSNEVTLPEPADIVISDLRSVLPLFRYHLPTIADVRKRLLAPGGVLIPRCDTLWAGVVEAPELYNRYIAPWDSLDYGLDMQAARRIVTSTWFKSRPKAEQLLVEPQCWATLDYAAAENPNVSAEITWTAARAGTAHGLIVWFDTVLAEGISFSNAPGAPQVIYGSAFFPWPAPITLAAGDTVSVTLEANLVGEDYIWRWNTFVLNQDRPRQLKANFKQSTFFSGAVSLERLRKRAASYVPTLSEDGQINQFILALMDGKTSLDEIAHRVSTQFPARFANWQEALTRVGSLSGTYSR